LRTARALQELLRRCSQFLPFARDVYAGEICAVLARKAQTRSVPVC
jgi:hypothetical protein